MKYDKIFLLNIMKTNNQNFNELITFKDFYEFLQSLEVNNIKEWLENKENPEKTSDGKDKQESLLRLFAGLDLIDKLKLYNICKGNFNKKTIKIIKTKRDIFYYVEN